MTAATSAARVMDRSVDQNPVTGTRGTSTGEGVDDGTGLAVGSGSGDAVAPGSPDALGPSLGLSVGAPEVEAVVSATTFARTVAAQPAVVPVSSSPSSATAMRRSAQRRITPPPYPTGSATWALTAKGVVSPARSSPASRQRTCPTMSVRRRPGLGCATDPGHLGGTARDALIRLCDLRGVELGYGSGGIGRQ